MGKATVDSHIGDGLYNVTLTFEDGTLTAQISALTLEIADINADLSALTTPLYSANLELAAAITAFDNAVAALSNPPTSEEQETLAAANKRLVIAQGDYEKIKASQQYLRLRKVSREKRLAELEAVDITKTTTAWCADYALTLVGDVGTIESIRSEMSPPIIYPDKELGNAVYNAARDGQIQPTLGATPASAMLSFSQITGADKWRPRYRVGEITDLTGNTATVELDAVLEGIDNLSVNQAATVSAPVEYMSCNEAAFAVGDRVVVAFTAQDWSQPKVIGFESNPKNCTNIMVFVRGSSGFGGRTQEIKAASVPRSLSSHTHISTSIYNQTGGVSFTHLPTNVTKYRQKYLLAVSILQSISDNERFYIYENNEYKAEIDPIAYLGYADYNYIDVFFSSSIDAETVYFLFEKTFATPYEKKIWILKYRIGTGFQGNSLLSTDYNLDQSYVPKTDSRWISEDSTKVYSILSKVHYYEFGGSGSGDWRTYTDIIVTCHNKSDMSLAWEKTLSGSPGTFYWAQNYSGTAYGGSLYFLALKNETDAFVMKASSAGIVEHMDVENDYRACAVDLLGAIYVAKFESGTATIKCVSGEFSGNTQAIDFGSMAGTLSLNSFNAFSG